MTRRATGAQVDPESVPALRRLGRAIGDAGRVIEELPHDQRWEAVRRVTATMTDREREDLLIGVLVWGHAARILGYPDRALIAPPPADGG